MSKKQIISIQILSVNESGSPIPRAITLDEVILRESLDKIIDFIFDSKPDSCEVIIAVI